MKRLLPVAIFGLAVALTVVPSMAQQGTIPPPDPNCTPFGTAQVRGQAYPTGGLEPDVPVWCYTQPQAGSPTRILTEHGWLDTWDNAGPAVQTLNDGDYNYRVFDNFISPPDRFKSGKFINSDHWMLDLVDISTDRLSGGIMVSPDRTFSFVDGTLVVEVDAAAGSDAMGGANRFYEIDISPATAPTGYTVDALYGYGAFGFVSAIGCRLERNDQGGNFVCSMYDDSGRATDSRCTGDPPPRGMPTRPCNNPDISGRVWETQGVGTALAGTVTGNDTNYLLPGGNGLRLRDVWRQCGTNIHDLHCRDRFRMEVSKSLITLYVNGYQAMQISLTANNPEGRDARIPDSWFASGVRPYFTSWVNGGQHAPVRWHWNEVRVNPGTPPSASPSFCLGNTITNPDGTTSLNTCSHNHTPGQPEVGAVASTATPTLPPTATATALPTLTPVPTTTPTPTAQPTATAMPTATATPTPTCELYARVNGVDVLLPCGDFR